MPMDKEDYDLVKALRRTVSEGNAETVHVLSKILEAFNKQAQQIETLTQEVREMRREMTPPMDKPKHPLSPRPKTQKGTA